MIKQKAISEMGLLFLLEKLERFNTQHTQQFVNTLF